MAKFQPVGPVRARLKHNHNVKGRVVAAKGDKVKFDDGSIYKLSQVERVY